jgi:hypothetical protein
LISCDQQLVDKRVGLPRALTTVKKKAESRASSNDYDRTPVERIVAARLRYLGGESFEAP